MRRRCASCSELLTAAIHTQSSPLRYTPVPPCRQGLAQSYSQSLGFPSVHPPTHPLHAQPPTHKPAGKAFPSSYTQDLKGAMAAAGRIPATGCPEYGAFFTGTAGEQK